MDTWTSTDEGLKGPHRDEPCDFSLQSGHATSPWYPDSLLPIPTLIPGPGNALTFSQVFNQTLI